MLVWSRDATAGKPPQPILVAPGLPLLGVEDKAKRA